MFFKSNKKLRVEVVYWFEPNLRAYISLRSRMARLWGSDAMRLQIEDSMAGHLPQNIELTFSGLPLGGKNSRKRNLIFQAWLKTRRPAVFILLKHVVYRMSPEELAQLREKAIAVGVDHLDAEPSRLDLMQYDFHISASEAGRRGLETMLAEDCPEHSRRPAVEVLYLSYDRRLEGIRPPPVNQFSAVYLGAPDNAAIPDALSDDIRVMPVWRNNEMEQAVQALSSFNFHYNVRSEFPALTLRRTYKPFIKGITAAACRSNILVNRQVDDAVEFLTPDYPYLVDSPSSGHVEEAFRKAKEEFGSPEWHRGLEIIRSIRERVSGQAQARQFAGIVMRAAERA